MKIVDAQKRKAISPIIATVLVIAATLIAFAAVGGYMFGLFGSSTNTANVAATVVSVPATSITNGGTVSPAIVAQCGGTLASSGSLTFSNTGSANTAIQSFAVTFGGVTYTTSTLTGTSCTVSAGSTLQLLVTIKLVGTATLPSAGSAFNGYITTSNGAQVTFTGTFS